MRLTVLGHANIDVQLRVHEIPPPGESRPVTGRRTVYGGTACNIARHAAGLGVPTRLWSRVGPDFPPEWKAGLEDDGLELAFEVSEHGRTPTCFIFTDDQERQSYCMDQGAMAGPYDIPVGVLADSTHLHISTGDPESYLPFAKQAAKAGIHVAFDPGQEIHFLYDTKRFEGLLDASDTFFCNDAELRKALGFLRYGDAEQLLDHVDTVVVTHGANGASLHRAGHKPRHAPAVPATVIDPTGAGDALRAGWYAALAAGHDGEEALAWGQAAAAIVVGFEGPQSRTLRPDTLAATLTTLK